MGHNSAIWYSKFGIPYDTTRPLKPGRPLPIPKAPDYRTPEAITQRAREGGAGWTGAWARGIVAALKGDGKVYRDFMATIQKATTPTRPRQRRTT